MLAYDYPILGVFWSMLIFFAFFAWLMLLFRVFSDIFRSHDMGGFAKAMWCIFVLFVPFLGVFVYLIARGHSMTDRDLALAKQSDEQFRAYVQDAAGSASTADELAKLADLKAKGVLTDEEFAQQKAALLG
ncbi:MAG TPA: SHOCT domain-containing protein [Microthrixaceae bacterium]|nr:SHOCT domain-containing protein [Microthrixaceae bacterium]